MAQIFKEDEVTAKATFKDLRAKAERGETPELTLDEINEEIREVRRLRKERFITHKVNLPFKKSSQILR